VDLNEFRHRYRKGRPRPKPKKKPRPHLNGSAQGRIFTLAEEACVQAAASLAHVGTALIDNRETDQWRIRFRVPMGTELTAANEEAARLMGDAPNGAPETLGELAAGLALARSHDDGYVPTAADHATSRIQNPEYNSSRNALVFRVHGPRRFIASMSEPNDPIRGKDAERGVRLPHSVLPAGRFPKGAHRADRRIPEIEATTRLAAAANIGTLRGINGFGGEWDHLRFITVSVLKSRWEQALGALELKELRENPRAKDAAARRKKRPRKLACAITAKLFDEAGTLGSTYEIPPGGAAPLAYTVPTEHLPGYITFKVYGPKAMLSKLTALRRLPHHRPS